MRIHLVGSFLLFGLPFVQEIRAQDADPMIEREVAAVRAELARSSAALVEYTWLEHTEALVSNDLKSSTDLICRYDASGKIIRQPAGQPQEREQSRAVSRRPMVRGSADMRDYIERAISRIHEYVPPKAEQIDSLLRRGEASLGQSEAGKSEARFTQYFERGDSMVFTYDSTSKTILRVSVKSTLGSPKDPLTLEAIFERIPGGPNHLQSATLTAARRRVLVKMRNQEYQKVPN